MLHEFKYRVSETRSREISITANTEEEAYKIIENMYENGSVNLSESDVVDNLIEGAD